MKAQWGYPFPPPPPYKTAPPAQGQQTTTEALLFALQSVNQNLKTLSDLVASLDARVSELEAMLSDDGDDQPEPETYLNGTRRN